eukprot:scaffold32324_cov71-Phaeocystis_antarctica.AAC.2
MSYQCAMRDGSRTNPYTGALEGFQASLGGQGHSARSSPRSGFRWRGYARSCDWEVVHCTLGTWDAEAGTRRGTPDSTCGPRCTGLASPLLGSISSS